MRISVFSSEWESYHFHIDTIYKRMKLKLHLIHIYTGFTMAKGAEKSILIVFLQSRPGRTRENCQTPWDNFLMLYQIHAPVRQAIKMDAAVRSVCSLHKSNLRRPRSLACGKVICLGNAQPRRSESFAPPTIVSLASYGQKAQEQ